MAGSDEVELLLLLKRTVEGLLISQVANVWSIYGGLNRLHGAIERIFKHEYQVLDEEGEPDLWVFINGLSWLQPNLATSPSLTLESYRESSHVPLRIIEDKALTWIYKSLETHTLSQKLSWLLSDREHLLSCYKSTAFLSQAKFGEAALICLRAVELNQPALLTEINPCLYMTKWNPAVSKTHRRCSSYPESLERNSLYTKSASKSTKGIINSRCEEALEPDASEEGSEFGKSAIKSTIDSPLPAGAISQEATHTYHPASGLKCTKVLIEVTERNNESFKFSLGKFKPWNSLPSLLDIGLLPTDTQSNITAVRKSTLFSRSNSSQSTKGQSGSRTLPSTPQRVAKNASNQSQSKERTFFALDVSRRMSQLSPSVLQVDYSSLQNSDSSDLPKFSRESTSRRIHFPKSPTTKITIKNMNKKGKRVAEDATPIKGRSLQPCQSRNIVAAISQESEEPSPEVKSGPRDVRGTVPSKITRSVAYDEMTPHMSPTVTFSGTSRENLRQGSSSNLWDGSRGSSLNNSGTSLSWSRKSFMEDGGSSVQPMSTGYFPRPVEGQSLFSFLSSGQFSRPIAELDRENAHFSICEAMISAIEQVKCNKDEEISNLKQRLRLRKPQRQEERRRLIWEVTLLSDGKTDNTTDSVSPLSTPSVSPSESILTDEVEDLELDDAQNISVLKETGISISMASLYSEAELSQNIAKETPINSQDSIWSAESVALSLISQFSEKQLPRASDLKWLISEQEVNQQLLPLPNSWPVSPDDVDEDMLQVTPLRGNMEWAPPRRQLIFTIHPKPDRRSLMAKQNYRCAGCGMKVDPSYAHRFRYCEYLARYFCTGCHSNQRSIIPARILTAWDFARYSVSNFSFRLIDTMSMDPLFNVQDLSPGLYRKARALEKCRKLRMQLNYLKDLIFNCRFAKDLQDVLEREPQYMFSQIDVYSINDFVQVKQGELASRLQALLHFGSEHTSQCELCLARGFVCELCNSKEIIFPWQVARVSRCGDCGVCYHKRCLPPSHCPRCVRISKRYFKNQENKSDMDGTLEEPASQES